MDKFDIYLTFKFNVSIKNFNSLKEMEYGEDICNTYHLPIVQVSNT